MSKNKQTIGDPLNDVIATGKIGGSRQTLSNPEVQTANSPTAQNAQIMHETQQSERLAVQQSNMAAVSKETIKRKQQTIYLSPALVKWLRMRAIEEEREISEIAEDALNTYRRLHD